MHDIFSSGFQWWYVWPAVAIGGGILRRVSRGTAGYRAGREHRQKDRREDISRRDAAAALARERLADVEALMADHQRVNAKWIDYELDVAKLIDFPMMSDVREPLTVDFLRAKRAADGLRPAMAGHMSTDARLAEYRNAVRAYELAFDVAEREARRIRDMHFSGPERQRLNTARRLLTMAVDSASTTAERQLAYARARKELDGLLALPEAAIASLERRISAELGPANPGPANPGPGQLNLDKKPADPFLDG